MNPPDLEEVSQTLRHGFALRKFETPVLPKPVSELMRVCALPDTDFAAITEVVVSDLSLTGRVLRLANSPFYARRAGIRSVEEAVSAVGVDSLRELVALVSLDMAFFEGPHYHAALADIRRQCMSVAGVTRTIAKKAGLDDPWLPLAGLFHDVGLAASLLMLGATFPESLPPLTSVLPELDRIHPKAGWHTLKLWEMPDAVCDVVLHHHDPDPPGDREATFAVALADRLVHDAAARHTQHLMLETMPDETLGVASAALGFDEDDLASLREEATAVVSLLYGDQVLPVM